MDGPVSPVRDGQHQSGDVQTIQLPLDDGPHHAAGLHKQLVLKFTFADLTTPFEMRYSTIKRDSGLLSSYLRERAAIEALETSFKDLQEQNIISSYERKDLTGPRKKLLDVVFKIWPSLDFIKEAKAANKRLSIK
jgi:hypothetical protein